LAANTSPQLAALAGLGLAPHWRVVHFGTLTRLAAGQVDPRSDGYSAMTHVGPENIESGTGFVHAVRSAGELDMISGKYEFDEQAIVYSKIRPNLNKVCVPGFRGLCSADCYPIWIASKTDVDRDFLLYYMLSELFVRQAIAVSRRTGMPKVNRPDLAKIRVVLPPKAEQERIACVLQECDSTSHLINRLLPLMRKRFRCLSHQLLSGRRRLHAYKDVDWAHAQLGDLFGDCKERGRAGLPTLSVTIDRGLVRRESLDRRMSDGLTPEEHLLVRPGDIVYNTMRMWQGASGLCSEEGIVSPAYVVQRPRASIDPRFAAHWFKAPRMVYLFWAYSYGLTGDRLRLYSKDFAVIPVNYPPSIDEQQAIADILDTAQREIELLEQLRKQIQLQKRGLMQKLLTGEIRVPTEANA